MDIRLDIELKKRINLKRDYDNSQIILLYKIINTLEKSISGQVLKVVSIDNELYKIMEKRATRSYRIYFILIVYSDMIIIVDIVKKNLQQDYIDYLVKNVIEIYRRNKH